MVELIVVLVLLGIVGVAVIPRFLAPSAFNDVAARDGLLATIRAAQQSAMGRASVTFEIESDADTWYFVAKSGSNVLRTFAIGRRDVVLETGAAAAPTDVCASAFDTAPANDFALAFGKKGDLVQFTNGGTLAISNGVRICVNDASEYSVCVSPAGFAYTGDCDL